MLGWVIRDSSVCPRTPVKQRGAKAQLVDVSRGDSPGGHGRSRHPSGLDVRWARAFAPEPLQARSRDVHWTLLPFFLRLEGRSLISSHQHSDRSPARLVPTVEAHVFGGGGLIQGWQQHPNGFGLAGRRPWKPALQTLPGLYRYLPGRCCYVVEQASDRQVQLVA